MRVHLRLPDGSLACGADRSLRWASTVLSSIRILNIRCSECMKPITCLRCHRWAAK